MIIENMQNGEAKRSFIGKLREKFPKVPKWLTFEEHVKTAREHIKNDLIPGVTPGEQETDLNQEDQEQPNEV